MFLVSQDALEAMFLWCLWALTKRRDNIVVADMEVGKVPTRQGGLNFFDKKVKPGLRIFQVYSATIRSICFYLFV